jgi:ribosomal protein S18 acetylase RimI-like enzyme
MLPSIFARHRPELSVRAAQSRDLDQVRDLIESSRHVHLQLDWWQLEDWIGNPGFLLAEHSGHIVGAGMGVRDVSAVAWLRALIAQDGLSVSRLLDTLVPPMLTTLRAQGVRALNCMAWPAWLAETLPARGFYELARVVTMRKDELAIPLAAGAEITVREASGADVDAITAIDHAAFEPDWWYGQTTFFRAMRGTGRCIIAEHESQPVGYAFSHVRDTHAHITRLAVQPAYQRLGIGAQLMADLIEHARIQGVTTMTLNTQTHNHNSLRLYRRLGFVETDTVITAFTHRVD